MPSTTPPPLSGVYADDPAGHHHWRAGTWRLSVTQVQPFFPSSRWSTWSTLFQGIEAKLQALRGLEHAISLHSLRTDPSAPRCAYHSIVDKEASGLFRPSQVAAMWWKRLSAWPSVTTRTRLLYIRAPPAGAVRRIWESALHFSCCPPGARGGGGGDLLGPRCPLLWPLTWLGGHSSSDGTHVGL